MIRTVAKILVASLGIAMCTSCGANDGNGGGAATYTVTFDADGGTPVPPPLTVASGAKISEPDPAPQKEGQIFAGWHSPSGLKFNFASAPITKDLVLKAKWWGGPKQFIFVNGIDIDFNYQRINALFGSQIGKDIAVGAAFILYCFERPHDTMIANLRKHLEQARQYDIPVLVQLDAITFMNVRSDLWNWWDASRAGYNDDNRNNVEWTSWSADDAVKLGWLNWGTQIRLNPMPNLMSPAYRQATADMMGEMVDIVLEWYENLPDDRKWLLAGIKATGEMLLGANNWYYPNGNSYLDQPAANDPRTGISLSIKPSRGVQTIGYAALKTGGFKSSGEVTGEDIAMLAQKHSEFASKIIADKGVPRELIFTHSAGVGDDLESCLNDYASPAWSFYGIDATNPDQFAAVLNLWEQSDAPWFGIAEWSVGAPTSEEAWRAPLAKALAIPGCRFLSIYANVVGGGAQSGGAEANLAAIGAIKSLQN